MEAPGPFQIRRKPTAFPSPSPSPTPTGSNAWPPFPVVAVRPAPPSAMPGRDYNDEKPPPLPARPTGPALSGMLRPEMPMPTRPVSRGTEPLLVAPLMPPPGRGLRPQKSMPELSHLSTAHADSPPPTYASPFNATPAVPAATFGPGVGDGSAKKTFVHTALSEARHFAGGLIPHPTESTKHYTILRHSPPLVFYRGPSTSVAITIFSSPDHPLPADRTLWLQQRGFSGDSGMKIKAFFNATDSWLHVTPATQVRADQLEADSERAWQRDINKAAKASLKDKGPKKAHIPRETHVVRIPEASEDGYFRLILCTGRGTPFGTSGETSSKCKTLCTSPIFRIASTSTDSSKFRGASLSTVPLEMGVFVASMVATTTANRYIAPVRAPVDAVLDRVRPGFVASTVGGLVRDEVNDRSAERDVERDQAYFEAHQAHVTRSLERDPNTISPVGPDSGPEPPFPLTFQAKVVPGTGRSQAALGIPTANLSPVPDEIQHRLHGIYFGWACILPPKTNQQTPPPSPTYHEAVITIAPSPYNPPSVTPKPLTTVHILNLPTPNLLGTALKITIMGFLRSAPSPSALATTPLNAILDAASRDVCLTLVSLARENWASDADAVVQGTRVTEGRGLRERVGEVGGRLVERVVPGGKVPSVPLHWVGMRQGEGGERDRLLGTGGYWVAR